MPDVTRNVFISHVHEDDEGLGKIKDLLDGKGFSLKDSSITKDKPNQAKNEDYIKSILSSRIKWAGTFLVYVTPKTKSSKWVDWEIEHAQRLGKRIVGIMAHGEAECEPPEALRKYADAVVGWDSGKIIDAIEGRVNDWPEDNGKPRGDLVIARHSCK